MAGCWRSLCVCENVVGGEWRERKEVRLRWDRIPMPWAWERSRLSAGRRLFGGLGSVIGRVIAIGKVSSVTM